MNYLGNNSFKRDTNLQKRNFCYFIETKWRNWYYLHDKFAIITIKTMFI